MSAFCVCDCVLLTRTHNIPQRGLGMLQESHTHVRALGHTDTNKSHRKQIQEDSSLPNRHASAHIQRKRERERDRKDCREGEGGTLVSKGNSWCPGELKILKQTVMTHT